MYINYSTFLKLRIEAEEETGIDMYIAERGWEDWMGNDESKTEDIIALLEVVYASAQLDFAALRKMLGVTQAEMIRIYGIPRRTLQQWESGERKPAEHVRNLLTYAVVMETMNKEEDQDDIEG